MNTGALGYNGKYAEQSNPTKKMQIFQAFDAEECKLIIEGIENNLDPVEELAQNHHGAKEKATDVDGYILSKQEKGLKWIYERITPLIKTANTVWNFDVVDYDDIHMLRYGVCPFSEWKMHTFNPETVNRKMVFHIALNDPSEYKEGDLEFHMAEKKYTLPRLNVGEMVIFPAFLLNRISAVKGGQRYSMVSWVNGTRGWF